MTAQLIGVDLGGTQIRAALANSDYLADWYQEAAAVASLAALLLLGIALPNRAWPTRVCGVAPGITLHSGDMDDDEFERAHRMTPLQRSSTPDDVAQAVRYLLSATAVTGTTLLVDGGQHLQAQPRDVMFMARESKSS